MAAAGPAELERLAAACRALIDHYPTRNWWPARSRFEVMVGAVLVQNTRWLNAARAIEALRAAALLQPAAMAEASAETLARWIRPAGCQRIKARRLLALAIGIQQSGGLRALAQLEDQALRARLLRWHGIGEETADAILLYGFKRPAFLSDGYARRWLSRMGIFEAGAGPRAYGRCRQFMAQELVLDVSDAQALHAAVVLHGQQHCGARPRCEGCCVANYCLNKTIA